MESPIVKLRATEKILEETRNELARTREELHNAQEEVKRLTPNSKPKCGIKNITISNCVLKEAQIVTEIQELLADEIKARLSKGVCTREIAQLVEPLAKLRIKG